MRVEIDVGVLIYVSLVFISGFLLAAGLLLSWPHNPLWFTPSLIAMLAALGVGIIIHDFNQETKA